MSNNLIIPLSIPEISGNEWKYVKECLDTGWVSSVGSYVTKFEEVVKNYVGCEFAIATSNGTAALHMGLMACGVAAGDEVIVPTLTFIASVNVVKYCNANPVFMDCDPDTLCLDVVKIADFIEKECIQHDDGFMYNKTSKMRIKAVIPVHLFGHPVDMDPLIELCGKFNIDIVEDATESLGSEYKGVRTGSFSKVGCLSFNGNKIITTGGGGMVVTNNKKIAERIKHLTTQAKKDEFEYDHDEIGYNYRLTNVSAAIGVAQMERIDEFVANKRENFKIYNELLSEVDEVELLSEKQFAKSNYWFYTLKVSKEHKKGLIEYLLNNKIQVRPIWKLIHTLPMYRDCEKYHIENAKEAYESCINLPCSLDLKFDKIEIVCKAVKEYFRGS